MKQRENRFFNITVSQDTMDAVNFCYFTLNYLAQQPQRVEDVADGLSAVIDAACVKMDSVLAAFYGDIDTP